MRVVGGKWGGRALRAPRGTSVRPTSDKVREAIFGILGERVEGATVLDLFAGTGAMAIEALSRGAAGAVLVEPSAIAFAALKSNLASLGATGPTCVPADYRKALRRLAAGGMRFTLVFLDPPYGKGLVGRSAAEIERCGVLAAGALVVAERAARDPDETFPPGWSTIADRRYGDTRVTLCEVPRPGGTAAPGRTAKEAG